MFIGIYWNVIITTVRHPFTYIEYRVMGFFTRNKLFYLIQKGKNKYHNYNTNTILNDITCGIFINLFYALDNWNDVILHIIWMKMKSILKKDTKFPYC